MPWMYRQTASSKAYEEEGKVEAPSFQVSKGKVSQPEPAARLSLIWKMVPLLSLTT